MTGISRGLMSLYETPVKRKVFISYHHGGDQAYYDAFSSHFDDRYDIIYDNSLDRVIDSENTAYVMQRIKDNFITGSSCTIVLIGADTHKRKYIDWEIEATLDARHGLVGIRLPTAPQTTNGGILVPDRFLDNYQSGYAVWSSWDALDNGTADLAALIEQANARDKNLIRNGRARRLRNG